VATALAEEETDQRGRPFLAWLSATSVPPPPVSLDQRSARTVELMSSPLVMAASDPSVMLTDSRVVGMASGMASSPTSAALARATSRRRGRPTTSR
jgi:hypothetical protein